MSQQTPRRFRFARALSTGAVALAAVTIASGCAKPPTVIRAQVAADTAVPPLYILRSTVVRSTSPADMVVTPNLSQAIGDAADRPGAYQFPLVLDIPIPPGWSGDVQVTIDGVSWDDKTTAVAQGLATVDVKAEARTDTTVTLAAIAGAGGGSDGGATNDGGAATDAAPGDGP